jgi:hypothetical protein
VGKSPCEGSSRMVVFRLRLCNFDQDPIAKARCRVHQGDELFTATADEDGFVIVVARKSPETLQVEWTKPDREDEKEYPYRLEVYIGPGKGETGGMERLHNVGYSAEQTLEDRVRAYQMEFGRAVTGVLADIEDELTKWHDGGPKPEGQIA